MTCADVTAPLPRFASLAGGKAGLRPFGPADITTAYLAWLNDPEVVRYSNQRFRRHDKTSAAAYLASFNGTDNLFLCIEDVATRQPVGTMTAYRSRHHGTADVGIMVGERQVQGQGYGLEAWQLLVGWLLDAGGARKVTCGTLACNLAMRRVAERSGMRLEATRSAQEIVAGAPQDILYFARFRSDP